MCEYCHSFPCRPQCPNFEDEPVTYCEKCDTAIYADDTYYEVNDVILCENCVYECRRTADREPSYNGKPAISYGEKWEE